MRTREFTKSPLDIYGEPSVYIELLIFEKESLAESGYIYESKPQSPQKADISYFSYLKKFSKNPVIGDSYLCLCLAMLSRDLRIFGDLDFRRLIDIKNESGDILYILEDSKGNIAKFPDDRLVSLTYYNTYFFNDQENYDHFRSAIMLKYSKPLPEIDFNNQK